MNLNDLFLKNLDSSPAENLIDETKFLMSNGKTSTEKNKTPKQTQLLRRLLFYPKANLYR